MHSIETLSLLTNSAIYTTTWAFPSQIVSLPTTNSESTLWHILFATSFPKSFVSVTHFVIHDAQDNPSQWTTSSGKVA